MSSPHPQASGSTPSASEAVRVYRAPSSSSPTLPPPADDDLKPTPEELKAAFKSTLLGRHGPDAPLLTRALREKEEQRLGLNSSKNRHWDHVKIRIRFSDRTMVEGSFSEADTINKVYEFLESVLDPTVKGKGVVIYTAPPKVEYRRTDAKVNAKTLRQLGLIPSAVVSLRWDDPQMNSNAYPAPIRQDLSSQAQDLPATNVQPPTAPASAPEEKQKPLPKWLKNIVKK
ncbi:alveolar soft part sarcoma chromosome candidate 1-like [Moesziomyces antarcticus]|uniref:Alveolar soft part sarcoma chromosome candidate 1-like n=1 Tax=Pseudozyma antarctica TaxID=84753 RepID=A0A081CIX0_PSEA2|nr:alveolar soft part sarcoma chromosome candidate 1-like [Moesziomyces antarcticus]GAK66616.1 alveolar soft part sarcoma chromosome candidate 1-like [Moesziomyces antarcticus]